MCLSILDRERSIQHTHNMASTSNLDPVSTTGDERVDGALDAERPDTGAQHADASAHQVTLDSLCDLPPRIIRTPEFESADGRAAKKLDLGKTADDIVCEVLRGDLDPDKGARCIDALIRALRTMITLKEQMEPAASMPAGGPPPPRPVAPDPIKMEYFLYFFWTHTVISYAGSLNPDDEEQARLIDLMDSLSRLEPIEIDVWGASQKALERVSLSGAIYAG
ncbi:uncharacterized protein BO97DRAFT_72757 [Aspergillus homomorphus CBS 101889]|uniref:Uncharacterized protein n=1 Tax=Aspergillus homomorphus (strain CBS 101889) TaxID=1450537 RepID=A0A395I8X5_ASPHC|nr:hypothetical protein BO97DRAFT_72757 [Aspergillus homomorphus CBS 101889]RAL16682.1 hypothetical protein BO97DRAFT_72757 [Aspergillus homomorphus CBS 101889]